MVSAGVVTALFMGIFVVATAVQLMM
jgi:hypothetical protein